MTGNKTEIYQRIDPAAWGRIFVMGDLHGCYQQLMDKLTRLRFDRQTDLLVSVGDLIDRGADNLECLRLLHEPWFCAVRGNHEQMAYDALRTGDDGLWLANGGKWFIRLDEQGQQEARQLIATTAALPLVIDIDMGKRHIVVAHADYPADRYEFGNQVDTDALMWSRRRINLNQQGRSNPILGATHFFFGHTPLDRIRHYYNQYYIDTGAVYGGQLTVLELNNLPV
ncbi:metallophosphoesterase [Biostraticola tofi]|uniref:Serine/threonine protein phosphatase 1 n=1 Tax=Biostraticola tofi TaxID=466109 RepID=A0A4R3YUQ8_9GAMM|nr:metallophosphoesterase [Biostraticola tofi]TCV95084.1 serine/threonine protein phosphatase 1 [Biostraticola tofi]